MEYMKRVEEAEACYHQPFKGALITVASCFTVAGLGFLSASLSGRLQGRRVDPQGWEMIGIKMQTSSAYKTRDLRIPMAPSSERLREKPKFHRGLPVPLQLRTEQAVWYFLGGSRQGPGGPVEVLVVTLPLARASVPEYGRAGDRRS